MRFLLDVNVGRRIALALAAAGHDVVRLALVNSIAEDPDILDLAVAGNRILITCDRDFSELVFARDAECPPAIIYLRFPARSVEQTIQKLVPILDFEFLKDNLTVIDPTRIRRAPFPARSNNNA